MNIKKILLNLKLFFANEDGQTSTEYILLVGVVALIIFKLKSAMSGKLNSITDSVFSRAQGLVDELNNP